MELSWRFPNLCDNALYKLDLWIGNHFCLKKIGVRLLLEMWLQLQILLKDNFIVIDKDHKQGVRFSGSILITE